MFPLARGVPAVGRTAIPDHVMVAGLADDWLMIQIVIVVVVGVTVRVCTPVAPLVAAMVIEASPATLTVTEFAAVLN
jgi:hypothetical protein